MPDQLAPETDDDGAGASSQPRESLWRRLASPSLAGRILIINIFALVLLTLGILFFNQFRQGLISARSESLGVQAQIIASAIAGAATADTSSIVINPDKMGDVPDTGLSDPEASSFTFAITPDTAGPVLHRLLANTAIRGQIIDSAGDLIVDTTDSSVGNEIIQTSLAPKLALTLRERISLVVNNLGDWLFQEAYPLQREYGLDGNAKRQEIAAALNGSTVTLTRLNTEGQTVVSVVVPIQRFRAVQGALILSTKGAEIDGRLRAERRIVYFTFLLTAAIGTLLSLLLGRTIARPIRLLSASAERVRRGVNHSRVQIPDLTYRRDEIGQLSSSLRHMTQALYDRIAAIEAFAADVAHELKNPLTSMRSAVETFHYAKTDEQRGKLIEIVVHDVQRMDRLISDISDASRLDAELARSEAQPLDVAVLAENIAAHANETAKPGAAQVDFTLLQTKGLKADKAYRVLGHDSRLGQVLRNLIDNARSFTAPGTRLALYVRRRGEEVEVRLDDHGPGISPENLEKVFERFYTDRPGQDFGGNSGLGLAISRQVIEAHKGRIWAENIYGKADSHGEKPVLGARFVIRLPALPEDWQPES